MLTDNNDFINCQKAGIRQPSHPRSHVSSQAARQLGVLGAVAQKELCEFVRQARLAATDFSFKIEEAFNGRPMSKVQSGGESGFNRVVPFCVSVPDQALWKKIIGCSFALNDPPGTRNRGTKRTDGKYTKSLSLRILSGGTREGHSFDASKLQLSVGSWAEPEIMDPWSKGATGVCVGNVKKTCCGFAYRRIDDKRTSYTAHGLTEQRKLCGHFRFNMEHQKDRRPKGACPAVTTASFGDIQDSL